METINIPVEVLIDHLYTGGHPVIIKWMISQASTWSIPQRKAIHEEISQGLQEEKLTDVQKHYLMELRMSLIRVEVSEASQYA